MFLFFDGLAGGGFSCVLGAVEAPRTQGKPAVTPSLTEKLKLDVTTSATQATLCKIPTKIQRFVTPLSCGAF